MAPRPQPQTPKEHFQQLSVLWMALISGQVMILALLYFFVGKDQNYGSESSVQTLGGMEWTAVIGLSIFALAVGMGFWLYRMRTSGGALQGGTLMEKIEHYRASFIVRAACIEAGVLLLIILNFFVQPNFLFLMLAIFGIALFFLIRPSKKQFISDYQLSGSEQSELKSTLN